ncbi:DUF4350 domain-containing protein [Ruania suaedae]|uniref:DUF4350 domain-containing protein n=1 Tax=Ruania suaedae TaxID=2897774 RepID=UPI001E620EB3|nr:DUF4350 domain-containing protein [Ruania suaedae]UFU02184.1 DUF4350 domain-containing protein [Ruania suaedae]
MSTITARGQRLAEPRSADSGRRSNRRGLLIAACAVVVLLAGTVVLGILVPRESSEPLAPANPEPDGARAAAQILSERGVEVQEVTTTRAVLEAAGPGSTLLITDPQDLRESQLRALREVGADVVVTNLGFSPIEALTEQVTVSGGGAQGTYAAECGDEHASAAEEITTAGPGVLPTGNVEGCFPLEGEEGAYAFATWREGEQRWSVLPNPYPLTNEGLAQAGNAALTLRLLGQHEHLTWYVPDPADPFGTSSDGAPTPVIPTAVWWFSGLLALTLVLWRGRHLGRVVVEPLPVVVRATETIRGRGRLYRRARAFGHAGAALRAGTVRRLARRTGLARTAQPGEVVDALARASGRRPEEIDSLLYGPPPTDDATLLTLTHALDTLEGEVHRS